MYIIVRPDMEEELAVEFVYTLTMFSMMYSIATACPVFLASYSHGSFSLTAGMM